MSRHDTPKARRERAAFFKFALITPLSIEPASVASLPPPHPDIFCRIKGIGEVGFELVEVVDEGVARRESLWINRGIEPGGGSYSESEPLLRAIGSKLARTYSTPLERLELLVYDRRMPADPRSSTWRFVHERVSEALESSAFSRVWVHNWEDRSLVFVEPPTFRIEERRWV